jgi:hypothetical protein
VLDLLQVKGEMSGTETGVVALLSMEKQANIDMLQRK